MTDAHPDHDNEDKVDGVFGLILIGNIIDSNKSSFAFAKEVRRKTIKMKNKDRYGYKEKRWNAEFAILSLRLH